MTDETKTTPKPVPKAPAKPRKPRTKAAPPPGLAPAVWAAALVLLLDQATKYIVVHIMQLDRVGAIDLIDPWLNLRMAWNQGMNFGLMASDQNLTRWLLIAVALGISAWVGWWLWRNRPGRLAQIAAGVLIGGALGNVIDRLTYGAVADFLNMSLPGWHNPYSFNVADIAIFIGAFGLVLQPGDKTRDGGKKPR
ncbi:MAG: signal peptidase II [Paracoccus sp. (in: a-proteobacteria)]|uniref:signal peptidase II n=1 Tax=Paracoccus sp. TaxID=267 RepID=UPI0026E082A6|nr:signal peptidase II [Paracoccus sp. (in: a-proteobacteria)]MDO5621700.1 signal peptidase II [Paracoccus sp. (in: a-proteobacteria)]